MNLLNRSLEITESTSLQQSVQHAWGDVFSPFMTTLIMKQLFNRKKVFCALFLFLSFLIVPSHPTNAYSFPFRAVQIGDPIPPIQIKDFAGPKSIAFTDFQNRSFVVFFWGADLESKKSRSIAMYHELQKLTSFFATHNIELISINIQNDPPYLIKEVIQAAGTDLPVFIDPSGEAYRKIGVYVMPALLLVNKQGQVTAGIGFGREMVDRLKGEIEIMVGLKTRQQVDRELHPAVIAKSREEVKANLHLQSGYTLNERGFPDKAVREFKKALAFDPQLTEAHIELGCIYVDSGQLPAAEQSLQVALRKHPGSVRGQTCRAELLLKQGHIHKAQQELEQITKAHPENPETFYALGTLYEQQKKFTLAGAAYRKAYQLIYRRLGNN